MGSQIELAQINGLIARHPDFATYTPASAEHLRWLGEAHALIARWDPLEAMSFKLSADNVGFQLTRDQNVAKIFGTLHRAAANIELNLPQGNGQAFGPGAVYDVFKALNSVMSSAQISLLIADPYMDDSIFDLYLSSFPRSVGIRLLVAKYSAKVKPAAEKFVAQFGIYVEVRKSAAFHDRLVIVDGNVCWVIGQSLKDAAANKPTYLAPLSSDVSTPKAQHYEDVWNNATAI